MRILIIEDNEMLAKTLAKYLKTEGFAADYVLDGEAGQQRIELYQKEYDAVILDWMLPKKDGAELLKDLRGRNIQIPVLMLSAKDEKDHKISGLKTGADDYMIKHPFYPEELVARLHAILRRPRESLPSKLQAGQIVLDPVSRRVWRDGKELSLTLKEFTLLEYLMRNRGRVVDREQIYGHAWDFASNAMSNVIDVHMHFLRKKINADGMNFLETIPGVGYRINE